MSKIFIHILPSIAVWIAALGIAFWSFDDWEAQPQSRCIQMVDEHAMPPSDIMGNNLRCMLVNMSGIAFAGIPTVFNLAYNGFISGLVLRQISSTSLPFNELYYYGRHHAIEFIALWLSGGVGLYGISLWGSYLLTGRGPDKKSMKSLGLAGIIVIVITGIAALLETEISIAAFNKNVPSAASVDSLVVIPRESWGAHPCAPEQIRQRDDSLITSIIIHHSGFPGSTSPLRIQEFQMNIRGMDDIAYHYYINSSGCVFAGHPTDMPGQHTSSSIGRGRQNDHSIGVCLGGNFETDSCGPSVQQKTALRHLLVFLRRRFDISTSDILFHRDFNPESATADDSHGVTGTVCPGRYAVLPLSKLIDETEGL